MFARNVQLGLAYDRTMVRKIIANTTGLSLRDIPDDPKALIPFDAINSFGELSGYADLRTASLRFFYRQGESHLIELFPSTRGKRFDVVLNSSGFYPEQTLTELCNRITFPRATEAFLQEAYRTLS